MNILDIDKEYKANTFDCTLASDVIEHLEKDAGYKLLNKIAQMKESKTMTEKNVNTVEESLK